VVECGFGHRYLKVHDGDQFDIDWRRVKRDERYDGKFLFRSNAELSAAEIGWHIRSCGGWNMPSENSRQGWR
jgi:hypothetical protein